MNNAIDRIHSGSSLPKEDIFFFRHLLVYKIDGQYYNEKALPRDLYDRYYFALAAEQSWSEYLLKNYIRDLNTKKHIQFGNRTGSIAIELGTSFFELIVDDFREDWLWNDIHSISLKKGVIIIESEKFAKSGWLSHIFGSGRIRMAT